MHPLPSSGRFQESWQHDDYRHVPQRSANEKGRLISSRSNVSAISGFAEAITIIVVIAALLWRRRKGRLRRKVGAAVSNRRTVVPNRNFQSTQALSTDASVNAEKKPHQLGFVQMLKEFVHEVHRDTRAIPLFLVLVLSLLGGSAAAVALSYAQKDYITALAQRDSASFSVAIFRSLVGLMLALPTKCAEEFSTCSLALVWRDVLVKRLLAGLFEKGSLHWLRLRGSVRDPDARVAQDAHHFAEAATLFVRDVFESILRLLSFSVVVVRISPLLLVVMLVYSALGTIVTVWVFGAPLVRLDQTAREQQQLLRRGLGHCYEGAEGMTLSCGERWEARRANDRYADFSYTGWRRTRLRVFLAGFRDAWSWASQLVPVIVLAPLYLSGWLDLGSVTQAAASFKVSLDALSIVVRKIRSVASLTSEGQRLLVLRQEIKAVAAQRAGNTIRQSQVSPYLTMHLTIQNLVVWKPGDDARNPLIKNLSLHVPNGMRLLVTGNSGCGKTTMLRALAGLWADCTGEVDIVGQVMFLPQTAYHPMGASLRQLVHFPGEEEQPDSEVLRALTSVGLESLVKRFGLHGCADWKAVISPGEQQRISFARILLHKPDIVLLDEATSALDEANEALLYSNLNIPIVISVGHRPLLHKYHTHVLNCVGEGEWDLSVIQ
jgi:putative ATP-binding cassette transporter